MSAFLAPALIGGRAYLAPATAPVPDSAQLIPSSRTVNFDGGTNRVDFAGGVNHVDFNNG